MSGKYQRRIWELPLPSGNSSYYDRMHIVVGRANSTNILLDQDTLIKTLLDYVLQQDTLITTLTSLDIKQDTLINVSISFNYMVDHDTLINIIKVIPPTPVSTGTGGGIQQYAPIGGIKKKKKKKADEIIDILDKIDLKKYTRNSLIQLRVESLLEIKLNVGNVELLTQENINKLQVISIDLIENDSELEPVEVKVLSFNEEDNL